MKRILLIFLNINVICATAQIPEIIWQKCWGSEEHDKSHSIIADGNNYLIAIHIGDYVQGLTNYHGMGDIWIQFSDSLGNIIWERCYGGSSGDVPQKILKKAENEFFIYGYSFSTDGDVQSGNNGYFDIWVVKINGEGNIIWEHTYGCTGIDDPRDMILTPDGGFVMIDRIGIGGGDVTNFYGVGDVWMCKCDSLGNIEWEKTLGNEGLDNCISMIMNSDNNIMMIGAVQKHGGLVDCYPDEVWGDVWIVELDLQGNIVSQHCYGGSDYELGYSLIELDEGYAFTASTYSNDGDVSGLHGPTGGPPDGWNDIWVVKLDENMEIDWQKCLGGYAGDNPEYISQTLDGGFIIIGWTHSNDGDVSGNHSIPGVEETDIWVVKLNLEGEIEWQQCYGGRGNERIENPHCILKKDDYNYVIASSTNYGPSYDIECTPTGGNPYRDAWVFEIKDCSQYMPAVPATPAGEDSVCNQSNETYLYTISPAALAWDYEWALQPDTAGTLTTDTLEALIEWADDFTGTATLMVRSTNDCGFSEWSVPKYVQVNNCLGTGENMESKIRVFPNPAKEYVEFQVSGFMFQVGSKIRVLSVLGDEVAKLPIKTEKTVWDVRHIKPGLYFYSIEREENYFTGKIVIQK